MDERIARLEATVGELRQAVLALEQRLERLEADPGAVRAAAAGSPAVEAAGGFRSARQANDPIVILTLIGRLFLVLAGGFFLRAMTDTHVLVPPLGLSIGFAYAMVWLFFADRAGGRQQTQNAFFHALATAMIAFPLLVEAATKFRVLPGAPAAVAVAVLSAAMLFVAWHRRLRFVAWIAVIGALPTSALLLSQTGAAAPFALFLIVFGIATLWFGYTLDWWGLRWPAAVAADLAVIGVTMRVLAPVQPDPPQVAILMQLTLLGAYVASIAIRTLVRGRNVVVFEVVQTLAALVVGFGGALYITRITGILPAIIGLVSLAMGVASYGVAVVFLDRSKDKGSNVYYYTTLALVHVIAGLSLVIGEPWLGALLAALAVVAAWLWARFGRSFMLVHGAAYLLASAVVSGVLGYCAQTLATAGPGRWQLPEPVMVAVLAAGAMAVWLSSARRNAQGDEIASGLRLVVILVFIAAGSACVIGYLGPIAAARPDGTLDPGAFATVGTAVLAVSTLFVAWLGRKPRFREWSWLVYPLLVCIGVKMAAQDFKLSRPSTLFIAMALYGAALIVAPRLRRDGARTVVAAE